MSIMSSESSKNEETKNITIRGVDVEIYEAFTNKLRDYNMNIGEAFNKMIHDVLSNFDEVLNEDSAIDYFERQRHLPKLSLESLSELTVSAKDLQDTRSRISFQDIEILTFDDTVTKEVFLGHVKDIRDCSLVRFGMNFPKLIAFGYCEACDNVEFE